MSKVAELKINENITRELDFTVESVIYQEEGNTYRVAEVRVSPPIMVGYQLFTHIKATVNTGIHLFKGMNFCAVGVVSDHKRHGLQLDLRDVEFKMPEHERSFIDMLNQILPEASRGLVKTIDSKLSTKHNTSLYKFISSFDGTSPDTLDVMTVLSPDERDVVDDIRQKLMYYLQYREVSNFLKHYNFNERYIEEAVSQIVLSCTPKSSNKALDFQGKTIEAFKENPYILMGDETIPFRDVDRLALKLGIKRDSEIRVGHTALNELLINESEGHTWMSVKDIATRVSSRLGGTASYGTRSNVTRGLSYLKYNDLMVHTEAGEVARAFTARAEEIVASKIASSVNSQSSDRVNVAQAALPYNYNDNQLNAIKNALTQPISILTGGPGTGKTATVAGIIAAAPFPPDEIMLMAPTGRAARRMSEMTGLKAKTIHSATGLGESPFNPLMTGSEAAAYDEVKIDGAKLIILDEASMLDIHVLSALLKKVDLNKTSIVFVGDKDQLESVGPGSVLKNLIESGLVSTTELRHVYRTGMESGINELAEMIREEEIETERDLTVFDDNEGEVFCIPIDDDKCIIDELLHRVERLTLMGGADSVQVLTPMRKETNLLSTTALNPLLKKVINPNPPDTITLNNGASYSINDKIIFNRNTSTLKIPENITKTMIQSGNYRNIGRMKPEKDMISNGEVLKIVHIERKGHNDLKHVIVSNGENLYMLDRKQLRKTDLAYALTIHKSQGSEYEHVVMPCSRSHRYMNNRALDYTGITRAKESVSLIGDMEELVRAIKEPPLERRTRLIDFITHPERMRFKPVAESYLMEKASVDKQVEVPLMEQRM
jgi:exodeoxyribonuclease V alpha subunit